ncbi:MAG: hypothetical protein N2C12_12845, partial [Planctomycetales bacterium]
MKWPFGNVLRRWASRKPAARLLRSQSHTPRLEILEDRRMLSGLLPLPGSSVLDVGSIDRAHDAGLEQRDDNLLAATVAFGPATQGDPHTEGMSVKTDDAESAGWDASRVDYRTNPLIAVLDEAILEIEGNVQQIQSLVDGVISNASLPQDQISATQLQIDILLERIDHIGQNTEFQGVPRLVGLLDSSGSGLLLDVGHHDPVTHPTRIFIPGISTVTLGGMAGRLF